MRRVVLIFLSLVLVLVGWSTVGAEDGFYVIPVVKKSTPVVLNAPVPKTGQTTSYGAGTDGDLKKGAAWPIPRFNDNNNGTVTDGLTGLIWMKNAGGLGSGTWANALTLASTLKHGTAGLLDGSKAGEWRLPNVRELQSLVDYGRGTLLDPVALPAGHPFLNVSSNLYWSSTTHAYNPTNNAWSVGFMSGSVYYTLKTDTPFVWCVRGGP